MFEYPEMKTLARQMETAIIGKTVESVDEVESIFSHEDYTPCHHGTVKAIEFAPPGVAIMLDNGYGILMRDAGGKLLYNQTPVAVPQNYAVLVKFTDGSSLFYAAGLGASWLAAVTYGDWEKQKLDNKKFDPLADHSFGDYLKFINNTPLEEAKKPVKTFLGTNIFGVRGAFAAEILLYAKVHPSVQLRKLSEPQHERIYHAMQSVLTNACEKGGRVSEFDLFGQRGGYIAMAERKHIGENCPVCGGILGKVTVGGVTAFCPECQAK